MHPKKEKTYIGREKIYLKTGRVNMTFTLNELAQNEIGKVIRLTNSSHMKRRLQDLGVVESAKIQRLHSAPGGDPTVYIICGSMIALRKTDAEKILVKKVSEI